MSSEQPQIPRDRTLHLLTTDDSRAEGERGAACQGPHRALFHLGWGQGLHTHTHMTDLHAGQLEAFVLPMKIRSINSHSAGAEESGRVERGR